MLALTVAPGQYVRPRMRRYSPDLRVVREKPYFDTSQDWLWDTRTSVLHSSRGSAGRNWTAAVGFGARGAVPATKVEWPLSVPKAVGGCRRLGGRKLLGQGLNRGRAVARAVFRTRHLPAHLGGGLVLAQSFMDHLPQQIVTGQGDILHLHDKFGPHPMHAA